MIIIIIIIIISFAQLLSKMFLTESQPQISRQELHVLGDVIYSIRRSGRLLNFWALRVGAFSRLGAY